MSKFVVAIFPDETKINRGTSVLKELHANGSVKLYASSVVTKDSGGKLSAQEITNEGLGGTAVGALIGGLAGLPAGPLMATIGAAGGALIGSAADRIGHRGEEELADKIASELAPGKAAIVAKVDEDGVISLKTLMKAIGGTVISIS